MNHHQLELCTIGWKNLIEGALALMLSDRQDLKRVLGE